MIHVEKIIKGFHVTEKTGALTANLNKYTFEVFPEVTALQVKEAVIKHFGVEVASVNTLNRNGKRKRSRTQRGIFGRARDRKFAIVTLKAGQSIDAAAA